MMKDGNYFFIPILQGNIKDFSVRKRMKYRQAQKAFEGLVQEIKSQAGFLRTYKGRKYPS